MSLLEGDLKEVDALREVKEELLAKKEVRNYLGSLFITHHSIVPVISFTISIDVDIIFVVSTRNVLYVFISHITGPV